MNLSTATKHEHCGITFYVGPRTPFPGIGWALPVFDTKILESSGAFYDGCDDHPEGAYAWAKAACIRFIDKALGRTP